jgi:hypothetical protein
MARRNHNYDLNDLDLDDYGEDYGQQLDDEELAIKESLKQRKKD